MSNGNPQAVARHTYNRRFLRYDVSVPLTMTAEALPPHWIRFRQTGKTLNLSQGGASAVFDSPPLPCFTVNKRVVLTLEHPAFGEETRIFARVVWIRDKSVGFEFLQVRRGFTGRAAHPEAKRPVRRW